MNDRDEPADAIGSPESRLAAKLQSDHPVPMANFRGELGRRLARLDPGHGPRPQALRAQVASLIAGGALLVLLGALVGAGAI